MDGTNKNDKNEKLNPTDPYDFDIKYSKNSPKSNLNELKQSDQNRKTRNINDSEPNITEIDSKYKKEKVGEDHEIVFEEQQPMIRKSSLNDDDSEIHETQSIENKRISELIKSNLEKKQNKDNLQEMGWDPLGLNVKKESLTEEQLIRLK